MSRRCDLTGVGVQFGNKVSHSQRKTRRRFEPNIRVVHYASVLTGKRYKLKIAAASIRTVEKNGGFDDFMLSAKPCKMSDQAKVIRKEIQAKRASI